MSLNWTNRPFFFPTVTLLSIPGFIERLCKLATRKVSEATGANFLQELEDWYTWLDNALVLDALMQMATEEPEQSSTGEKKGIYDTANSWLHSRELLIIHLDMFFCFSVVFFLSSPTESSDESSLATSPLRHRLPQSMKIVHEIMYKVEVLYVLCVLLMGRQRNQVLFPTIRAELEFFVWTELNCFFPPVTPLRFTRCWLSFVSSQGSTTCSTSSSGGNIQFRITLCMARMRTVTVVQYEISIQ